jgi:hypothetical protein
MHRVEQYKLAAKGKRKEQRARQRQNHPITLFSGEQT